MSEGAGLREALATLLDDAFTADHGSIDGGPEFARGVRYAVRVIEDAALATPAPLDEIGDIQKNWPDHYGPDEAKAWIAACDALAARLRKDEPG